MDTIPFSDFASSIRYALTQRSAMDGEVEIVLDLFRGAVPTLTRTIACVRAAEVAPVILRCRRHLERHGAHPVMQADPYSAEPEPAFGWLFAG